jgi:hypothetical protein
MATALMGILGVFEQHKTDLQEGWNQDGEGNDKAQVPVSTIFGNDRIRQDYAVIINKAIRKAIKEGKIKEKEPWDFFYQAAVGYIA